MSEFNTRKVVKTRKPHKCFGCKEEIKKGQEAVNNSGLYEDHFYNYYLCLECEKFIIEKSDEFFREGIWEDCVNEIKDEWM